MDIAYSIWGDCINLSMIVDDSPQIAGLAGICGFLSATM